MIFKRRFYKRRFSFFHKSGCCIIFFSGEIMRKYALILLVFVLMFLCSCTKVVKNSADELTSNSYGSEFENGNIVSLSFSDNNATLEMKTKNGESATISGFCEISDTQFVIFDSRTSVAYPFCYTVFSDHVDIMHDGNVLKLQKI